MRQVIHVDLTHISRQPWFDKEDILRTRVGILEQFNQIASLRRQYGHLPAAPLSDWVINGNWFLDKFGQRAPIVLEGSDPESRKLLDEMRNRLLNAAVRSKKEWSDVVKSLHEKISWGYSMGGGQHLPHHGAYCVHCRTAWGIENSNDAWSISMGDADHQPLRDPRWIGKTLAEVREMIAEKPVRGGVQFFMRQYSILTNPNLADHTVMEDYPGKPAKNPEGWASAEKCSRHAQIDWNTYVVAAEDTLYFDFKHLIHHDCKIERATEANEEATLKAFREAGVSVRNFLEMPNEYGSETYNGKWMLVQTDFGMFMVGWRKRVMFLRVMEMKSEDGVVRFTEVGKERHFDSYDHLKHHLRWHYCWRDGMPPGVKTTVQLALMVKVGGKPTGLHTFAQFCVNATYAALEALVVEHCGVDYAYNSGDRVTIGEQPLTGKGITTNWDVSYPLYVGSRQVGCIGDYIKP